MLVLVLVLVFTVLYSLCTTRSWYQEKELNSVALVRERTVPTAAGRRS
jgi:hypothetical protein